MLNIGLLFGGKSTEHDISILTMFQVKEKIESNYKIYSIYISKSGDLYLANDVTLDDFKENNLNKLRKIEWIKKGFKRSFKKVLILKSTIALCACIIFKMIIVHLTM